jgi:RNase P/RNase MRP subunit p29
MSDRSNTANAGQAGIQGHHARSCAAALVVLLLAWTGAPGAARADAIVLQDGESIDGAIVDATRNTVIVRRAMGGMRQMPLQDIAEVRLDLTQGGQIAGQLLRWVDGVHEIRSGGDIVRVSAGRILTRERRDQATMPPRLAPRPLAPQPGEMPTVKAAGPAATAPEAARALPSVQAAVAEVVLARIRAGFSATGIPRAQTSPAVAAPTPVGSARIAAAPRAVAPIGGPGAAVSIAGATTAKASPGKASPGKASPAKVSPAKISPDEVSPDEVSPDKVSKIVVAPAAVAAPGTGPAAASAAETDTAQTAPAVVTAIETGAATAASEPQSDSDDQRLAVRGTVAAETGADGVVFRIELSRPAEQPVVLIYGTLDGTAKAGKDYEPQQGVVTLTPGTRSADVRVPLLHPHPGNAGFELFLMADPKVADVIDQRIAAIIPATH